MEFQPTDHSKDQPGILQTTRFDKVRQSGAYQHRNIPTTGNGNEGFTDQIENSYGSADISGAKLERRTQSNSTYTRPCTAPTKLRSLGYDYSIHTTEDDNDSKIQNVNNTSSILTKHAETVSTATVSYQYDDIETAEIKLSSFGGNSDEVTNNESEHAAFLNCTTPFQNQALHEEDDHSPSPLPFAISTNSLLNLELEGDKQWIDDTNSRLRPIGLESYPPCHDETSEQLLPMQLVSRGENHSFSTSITQEPQQTLDSSDGGVAIINDTQHYDNNSQTDDSDGEGIVILNPSTEEEIAETLNAVFKRSRHGDDSGKEDETNKYSMSANKDGIMITSPVEYDLAHPSSKQSNPTSSSTPIFGDDSIILAAAADARSQSIHNRREERTTAFEDCSISKFGDSPDFHQLMREAECGAVPVHRRSAFEGDSIELYRSENEHHCTSAENPGNNSAHISRRPGIQMQSSSISATNSMTRSTHTPVRTTRIHDDKFIVEVDVFSPNRAGSNSRIDARDAIDIIANIDLLHLWFDPIQEVLDATVKDGSSSVISPQSSPASSHSSGVDIENSSNDRQYDGEWIEVSTPLLVLPKDAHISGCLRSIRVGFRTLVGFPARIRSIIFVERRCGRIGMTLGPFPDRWMKGTLAYHTFNVRAVEDENGQRIVITDEVRLQRDGDGNFNGDSFVCGYCIIFRLLFVLIEWFLFRWYQPDLASFMSQTMSSLMKLRDLIERGETMAYAGDDIATDRNNSEGGNSADMISAPLLG
ncbi:hypothetical protein ACHAXS_010945 [Conticribra weissflogii]